MFDQVAEIVAEVLDVDVETLTPETDFVKDLMADSLDRVEIMMRLEDEFSISIPDDVAAEINTIGDIVERLQGLND